MQTNIKSLKPYLSAFPDPHTVFADPVERYEKHLHPLASIDLSAINTEWSGKIHLVCPLEPYDGVIGEHTSAYHNDFLKSNWIAFKLGEDSRYELIGDFRYFLLENADATDSYPGHLATLAQHYAEKNSEFASARRRFLDAGSLSRNYVDQLGGDIPFMNWTVYCMHNGMRLNIARESDPEARRNVFPFSPSGKRFYFIAKVSAYNYLPTCGGGDVILFYEPEDRIAWLTFDYT